MFDGLRAQIDVLQDEVTHLVTYPGSRLSDELGELLVDVQREISRLEAIQSHLTQAWDACQGWRTDGARSGAAWLTAKCRIPRQAATRQVGLARALRYMPGTARAWRAGDITSAHVATLARARNPRTRGQFNLDEDDLVAKAKTKSFVEFDTAVTYWVHKNDADGAEDRAERQHEKRGFDLAESLGGMHFGRVTLDPLGGAAFSSVFDRIVDEMFRADWNEAKERLGDAVTIHDLRRTPTQRRADALVEMAIRAGTAPIDGKRPAPLFTALLGLESLKAICEMANGTVITPGSLVPWLTDAYVERVVFESPSRVIDVGEARRFFRGALRRAIEVRDRRCYHELCEIPADRCHVDHIIPAEAEGPTTQENGRLACDFHNWLRQRRPEPPS